MLLQTICIEYRFPFYRQVWGLEASNITNSIAKETLEANCPPLDKVLILDASFPSSKNLHCQFTLSSMHESNWNNVIVRESSN